MTGITGIIISETVKMAKKATKNPKAVVSKKKEVKETKTEKIEKVLRIKEIEKLRLEIIESPKNYNKLNTLINELKIGEDIENLKLVRCLIFNIYKIFNYFISKNLLKIRKIQNEQEKTVCKWLISKYELFQTKLFQIWNVREESDNINSNIATLKIETLETFKKILKDEAKYMGPNNDEAYFPNLTYKKILKELLKCGDVNKINSENCIIDDYLIFEFQDSYFNKYWDLKFYLFQELPNILNEIESESENENEKEIIFSKVLTLTKQAAIYDIENEQSITKMATFIENVPENTIYSVNLFKVNFEKSWIKLLNFKDLNRSEYINTLLILHKRILPFLSNASKLMDFLTATYTLGIQNKDILIAILSLNGLWELMKSYNLDYPDFYKNLYAILTPDLLHLREKARFFRLLDLFMSSTHLSSSIVASFIKKLARLSLNSPPSGIILIIPFIYNLIKKYGHSTCMLLIHSTTSTEEDLLYNDPFDETEVDPALTNAIESSIWELEIMNQHYHPNISALVKIFNQKFNKFSYNLEDFLDWNYDKLISAEFEKKLKGELGLEFEKWDSLYDDDGYLEDYLY